MHGLQCPKLLWYEYNRKEDLPEVDAAALAIMDQGKRVGELARALFPGGITLERDYMPDKQAEKSMAAARRRKPLFEAGFVYSGAYALADILDPVSSDAWDLIEVKSSSGMKDEYLYDVAFQKYTYEGAGLKIRRSYLMYVNRDYVRKGRIEPKKMFLKEDITTESSDLLPEIETGIDAMFKIIAKKDIPQIKVGPHCDKPRSCPLEDICWDFLPDKDDVFCLYGGTKKAYEFMANGILSLSDINEDSVLTCKQSIQLAAHKSGKSYIDKSAIIKFLNRLQYPLYLLDFETINPAIPLYDLSRPYETIPFQYSLHVVRKEGAEAERYSYLAQGDRDPRPEILKKLKKLLGKSGSIIAYNAIFEKTVLRKAGDAYPKYKAWVSKIKERFIDLLDPFRSFCYYNPNQAGSASLKDVLPVITRSNYKDLEIADGGTASNEYYRVTFGEDIDKKDRQRVRVALEKYCDLDTKGMIDILEQLKKLIE
jgi:hypothetical protein